MSEELLKQATDLLKEGQKTEAEHLVKQYLRENREDSRAWWVLVNSTSDPELKRKSLVQLLKLKPDFDKARQMLAAMEKPAPAPAKTTTEMLAPMSPMPKNYSSTQTLDSEQEWFFGIHNNPSPEMIQQYKKQSSGGGFLGAMNQSTLLLLGGGALVFMCCCCCLILSMSGGGG